MYIWRVLGVIGWYGELVEEAAGSNVDERLTHHVKAGT